MARCTRAVLPRRINFNGAMDSITEGDKEGPSLTRSIIASDVLQQHYKELRCHYNQ